MQFIKIRTKKAAAQGGSGLGTALDLVFKIGVGAVEGARRVVGQGPVLGDQGGGGRLGVFVKEGVVPHAEADDCLLYTSRCV